MMVSVAKNRWTVKANESGLNSAGRIKGPEGSEQLASLFPLF